MKKLLACGFSFLLISSILFPQLLSNGYASSDAGQQFNLSAIRAQDINGSYLSTSSTPGQEIVLTFSATNEGDSGQFYVAILQISTIDGTQYLDSQKGTALSGESKNLRFSWKPEKAGMYIAKAFLWTSIDSPAALSEPSESGMEITEISTARIQITPAVLTPLQESLQQSVEELKSEGKPYPKVTFETRAEVPTQSEIREAIESEGSFETEINAKTVIEYAGPEEAEKERWDDIVIESPEPSTVVETNTTELKQGNLTQMIIDEHPEIYGEGNGTYQYGEEPRTFVIDEAIVITFVEAENTTSQLANITTPITQTASSNMVMGFSFVPKKIDYTVNPKIRAGICPICITIAEAKAGFLFDVAFGLRLPVQVDITRPESMIRGNEYVFETSITPLDFSAEDYKMMGLPEEKGHEFFARFELFLGLKVYVIGIGTYTYGIDSNLDMGEQCTRETGLDCQDFVTPFGSDENGVHREFPIQALDLSPDVTGLEYSPPEFAGKVTVGLGLRLDPDIGSDKISAEWSASGDSSGNGNVVYTAAYPSKYPVGPILAGNSAYSDNSIREAQERSAVITLDNYKFHLDRQIVALYGNLQLELFGHDIAQTRYFKLTEFNFSEIFGEPVIGQHSGVTAISSTIPVRDEEEPIDDAEQIKNDMMSIAGVVGVSVNDTHIHVYLEEIESTILVPAQTGHRQVYRDVSGPICNLPANISSACQDALNDLGNEEFVKAKLLDITGVSSATFDDMTIVVLINDDEARMAIPDKIAGRTVILDLENEPSTIDKPDVAECLESFHGEISAPYNAASNIGIVALHGTYNVDFDYVVAEGDDGDFYSAHSKSIDPSDVTFVEKETISMELTSSNQPSGDIVTIYHKDISDCDILFNPSDIPPTKKIALQILSITQSEPFSDTFFVKAAIPDRAALDEDFSKLVVAYASNPEAGVWYTVPNVKVAASGSEVRDCLGLFNGTMSTPTVANAFITIDALHGTYEVGADYARIEDDFDSRGFAYYLNPDANDAEDVILAEDETITFTIKSNAGGSSDDSEDIVTLYTQDISECDILFHADTIPEGKMLQLASTVVTDLGDGNYMHEVVIPESIAGDSFTRLFVSYKDETESRVYYSLPNIEIVKPDSGENPVETFNISGQGSGIVECTSSSFNGTIAIDAAQGVDGTVSGTITITDPDRPATTVAQIHTGNIDSHEFKLISNNMTSVEGPFCHSGDEPDTIQVMGILGEDVEISFESVCLGEGEDGVECLSSKGVFLGDVSTTS